MRILIGALAVALLAGCASSMEERRADKPRERLSSSKTVDAVSRCILFSWQSYTWYGSPLNVVLQPNQYGGNTVTAGQTDFFSDVIPKGSKTQIDYYGSGAIGRELAPLVKACI
jgi:hypothetical protein